MTCSTTENIRARGWLIVAVLLIPLWGGCAQHKMETMPPPPAPSPPSPTPSLSPTATSTPSPAAKVTPPKVPSRQAPVAHDTRPTPKAPEPETPLLLSPALADEHKDRMESEVTMKLRDTEQLVAKIDHKHLTTQQSDTFTAIRNFISKAKEALHEKDMPRAMNLADKAQALAQDLPNSSGK